MSRDPIGEDGGYNLYAMVGNDAVDWWDDLGLRGRPKRHSRTRRNSSGSGKHSATTGGTKGAFGGGKPKSFFSKIISLFKKDYSKSGKLSKTKTGKAGGAFAILSLVSCTKDFLDRFYKVPQKIQDCVDNCDVIECKCKREKCQKNCQNLLWLELGGESLNFVGNVLNPVPTGVPFTGIGVDSNITSLIK